MVTRPLVDHRGKRARTSAEIRQSKAVLGHIQALKKPAYARMRRMLRPPRPPKKIREMRGRAARRTQLAKATLVRRRKKKHG